MKGTGGKLLYVGKAGNLRRRVSSYFIKANEARIEKLISEIKKIDYFKTDSALEALILEAELIKKHEPPYNIREKDGTSFLFIEITKDRFPRVLLVRGKSKVGGVRFGPFTSATSARIALRLIRKIFPFNIHSPEKIGSFKRACFDYEIGLCPGTCINTISREDCMENIRHIKLFLNGKKKRVLNDLKKEMILASKRLDFEKAEKLKRRIFALQHIQDTALIKESEHKTEGSFRIEGYDISNISGTSAVGSMVVFVNSEPMKSEYKKFRIKTIFKPDDTGMLREILSRRLNNNWPLPGLILIDGGKPQVNAAKKVFEEAGMKIPIIGIAKGPDRDKNEFIGNIPDGVKEKTLIQVRDEAHRFAITYHRRLRHDKLLPNL